jgi:hypothetical protein
VPGLHLDLHESELGRCINGSLSVVTSLSERSILSERMSDRTSLSGRGGRTCLIGRIDGTNSIGRSRTCSIGRSGGTSLSGRTRRYLRFGEEWST